MDPLLFASFIAATLIIVVSPGPSVALASSQAVKHGPRAVVLTVLGDALGTVVQIAVAVASLNALLSLAAMVLPFLQIAGGVFILYLAWQSFTATRTSSQINVARSAFLSGFFACVTNPKSIVFFVALFPGFLSPDLPVLTQSMIYGAIFVSLDAIFIFGYAMLARAVVNSALAPRLNIDRLSGIGLGGVGLLLIVKGVKELPGT